LRILRAVCWLAPDCPKTQFLSLAKHIKRLRKQLGLSQDKLSKLADISLNTVVKIELDQSPNPTLETIQKLAKALGVSLDDLVNK
jgi:transcriptional regulator with XRE-family HTH domain